MLHAGRAFDVLAWLEPRHESTLGFAAYHGLRAQAAAACGDYAEADAELDLRSTEHREVGIISDIVVPVRSAVALRVAETALERPIPGAGPAGQAASAFRQFYSLLPLASLATLMRHEADAHVLRGLLALEAGAVESARAQFRAALAVWGSPRLAASAGGLDFPARRIAQHALRLLDREQ
jgi:hypothetical protein